MQARVPLNFKEFTISNQKHTQKTSTLQEVIGGNTPNLVLKRIKGLFLKIPLLKKILEFLE